MGAEAGAALPACHIEHPLERIAAQAYAITGLKDMGAPDAPARPQTIPCDPVPTVYATRKPGAWRARSAAACSSTAATEKPAMPSAPGASTSACNCERGPQRSALQPSFW